MVSWTARWIKTVDGITTIDEQTAGTDPATPESGNEKPVDTDPSDTPPGSPLTDEQGPVATEPDPVEVEEPSDDDHDDGSPEIPVEKPTHGHSIPTRWPPSPRRRINI